MDIVGSRKVENRSKLQDSLIHNINILNKKFKSILAAPISITVGDEWQAITSFPWECYNIVHEFQQLLWDNNINFYAGIGIGTLTTNLSSDIRKMDGSCFHMAREAINVVKAYSRQKSTPIHSKRNKVYFKIDPKFDDYNNFLLCCNNTLNFNSFFEECNSDVVEELALSSSDSNLINIQNAKNKSPQSELSIETIINTIIENSEILKQKMTQKQKTIYTDYIQIGSYRKLLESKNFSSESLSSISQKLNSAEYFTIQHDHQIVSMILSYFCSIIIKFDNSKIAIE